MSRHFAELAYTPSVRAEQLRRQGEALAPGGGPAEAVLGPRECRFLAERDTAFLATVNAAGWPHLQHRGGPPGFLRMLDERTLAFADLEGNRQYVSIGNLHDNDRVALLLLDQATQRRLKILGRMHVLEAADVLDGRLPPELADEVCGALRELAHTAFAERVLVLRIAAFDWNCSRHITRRWSEHELRALGLSVQPGP